MDLSIPSTSTSGSSSAILCKAPAASSPAALTECVRLRPLFCSLSPETERGGELPEEVVVGAPPSLSAAASGADDMGLPEETGWPPGGGHEDAGPFSPLFSSLQDATPPPLLLAHDGGGSTPPTKGLLLSGGLEADEVPSVRGVCGLRNLGNTCFMNAGLQCLLSNGRLVGYFLNGDDCDGGHEGAVEEEDGGDLLTSRLAQLLRQVWSGNYSCLRPAPFKEALAQACPQFSDCRQHDCQEFLTLLLDTLHEQTNRASPGAKHRGLRWGGGGPAHRGSPQGSSGSNDSAGSWEAAVSFRGRLLPEQVQPRCGSKYSEAEESAVVGEEEVVRPDSPASTADVALAACQQRKRPRILGRPPPDAPSAAASPAKAAVANGVSGSRSPSPPRNKRLKRASEEMEKEEREGEKEEEEGEATSGGADQRQAQEAWAQYTARNQSVVVDTFQGQFRSTVVCSECGHVSVTYEPFMYLPVPLPHAMERHIGVTYVPLGGGSGVGGGGGGEPVRHYRVRVSKQDKVCRLVEALVALLGEPPAHGLALAEVADGQRVLRVLDEDMAVRCIGEGDREVYAFALGPWEEGGEEEDEGEEGEGKESATFPTPSSRAWHSCAICLEDMADDHLHMHPSCRCLLCRNCLEISSKHYGSESLMCPLCNVSVKAEDEFVLLSRMSSHRHRSRLVSVPLVFCQEGGLPWRPPALLRVPCHCHAGRLYAAAAAHLPPGACYSLSLVDPWGQRCSRCPGGRCGGCEVARVGRVSLQPGDCLALRCTGDDAPPRTTWPPSPSLRPPAHPSGSALTLYDCLRAFSESETLDEQNPWFCPVCRRNQRARKTLSVWRSPDTLMVYLKRFVFHEFSGSKVDERVEFPLEGLDLAPFVSGPHRGSSCLYDLHAYICHFGGVNCGHYTAYTRHWPTGEWYHYNDESVCKQQPRPEDQAHAYILFYQRRGTTGADGGEDPSSTLGGVFSSSPADGLEPTLPERGAATTAASLVLGPGAIQRILCRLQDGDSPPPLPPPPPPSPPLHADSPPEA